MAGKQKFYVVWQGVTPGIYNSWAACQQQIKGFQGAKYKSFPSRKMAEEAYQAGPDASISKSTPGADLSEAEKKRIGKPVMPSIAVDAACSGNPGIMEYQGVDTATGKLLFHQGPFDDATVNIGEFLALVHGLAMLKNKGFSMPVYSDSRTAIKWIEMKKANTKLPRTSNNSLVFTLISRAEKWLHENTYPNRILKWETKAWGEIPADFGRK
jgi:ribonuclease HI